MKKHLITCAVVLSLIAGTFFIVFTFENLAFALARVQFLPTSASYRGELVGKESKERIDTDRAAIDGQLQGTDRTRGSEAVKNSDGTLAVAEIAAVASR